MATRSSEGVIEIRHASGREEVMTSSRPDAWRVDLALAARAAQHDVAARSEVAERLFDRVRAMAGYLAGGKPCAEDFAQQALVEILLGLHTFRGESSLESWADRIAARAIMRQLRRRRTLLGRFRLFARAEEDQEVPTRRPEHDLDDMTLIRARLAVVLGKLDEKRRVAIVLKLLHGYSIEEIAAMTDTRENTVRDRLRRGRKELRASIRRDPLLHDWARRRGVLDDDEEQS